MGIEDEIRKYLQQGYTARQLMDMGYEQTMIYMVYSKGLRKKLHES